MRMLPVVLGPDVIVLCLSHCCLSVLSLSLFVALLCVSQETWTKACLTAAEFVITCGKQGVAVLKRMEESGKISGYTLKPLESITVPEDWIRVAALMEMKEHKATASRLRDVASQVLRDRWWQWVLMHPELKDVYIHPSRRVFPFSPCIVVGCECIGLLLLTEGIWCFAIN